MSFLIFANVAMLLLEPVAPGLASALVLVPAYIPVRPWTLVSYMFLHAGYLHLFGNMLALVFTGPRLEARLGGGRFIRLYLVSGITGGLCSLVTPDAGIIGASGAVFGVMLGYAHYWPRDRIYLFYFLPLEARWLVLMFTVLNLYQGLAGRSGIANFAHLGGFAGAFLYLRWMEAHSPAAQFRARAAEVPRAGGGDVERWRRVQLDLLHPVNREEYERVMAKVALTGSASLTRDERAFLDRFSTP